MDYKKLIEDLQDTKKLQIGMWHERNEEIIDQSIIAISDLIEEIDKLNKNKEKIIESARDSFSWCFGCKKANNCGYIDKCNSNNDFYESIWN